MGVRPDSQTSFVGIVDSICFSDELKRIDNEIADLKAYISDVNLRQDNVIKVKLKVDTSELDVTIEKLERLISLKNEYEASAIDTKISVGGKAIAKEVKKRMGDNLWLK